MCSLLLFITVLAIRFTPSDLQHWGSSLKCISGIQGGTEVSGIKARVLSRSFQSNKGMQQLKGVRGGESFFPWTGTTPSLVPVPQSFWCVEVPQMSFKCK